MQIDGRLLMAVARRWPWWLALPLAIGVIALAATWLVRPVFTARTTLLPPQPPQSAAATALASLGALGGLAGASAGLRSPVDQYVSLLQSRTIANRIIDEFKLSEVYDEPMRELVREKLGRKVRVSAGRKDGIITIDVDDHDPKRAAAMANRYVDELRRLTGELALTEAQQRRRMFEDQLKAARDGLTRAQAALEQGGFNRGAFKAEPRAAAERFARLQAEVTAAQVRLQTLRVGLNESTPEVQAQAERVAALRAELARIEAPADATAESSYVSRFREFKYQETLFDLFSRQYEMARVDESREGALIQVVDTASVPERKSWPRRGFTAVLVTAIAFVFAVVGLVVAELRRRANSGMA